MRHHCATVQPRLYSCAVATQITLRVILTQPGRPAGRSSQLKCQWALQVLTQKPSVRGCLVCACGGGGSNLSCFRTGSALRMTSPAELTSVRAPRPWPVRVGQQSRQRMPCVRRGGDEIVWRAGHWRDCRHATSGLAMQMLITICSCRAEQLPTPIKHDPDELTQLRAGELPTHRPTGAREADLLGERALAPDNHRGRGAHEPACRSDLCLAE